MRPYLAVIVDSFREALASRVLWVLLAIVTLFLLALLPLGIVEQAGSTLRDDDILSREALVRKLASAHAEAEPSPGRHIYEMLNDRAKQAISKQPANTSERRMEFYPVLSSLQEAITKPDFYEEADWKGVKLPPEAEGLLEKGLAELPPAELGRFNRLALEAAFPDEIAPATSKQLQAVYFSWELGLPLPFDAKQLRPAISALVSFVLGTLLGVVGVFIAVLVTASMIPLAFEAGSVDLLLSKPINRGWLFLAKFVGGCAFIAINAAYFIGGLWLILGFRFDIWNHRILWAIPLYLFLFSIYYGVSALAGVIWRNPIVSVVLAIVFWFVCFVLGTANTLVDAIALAPRRLVTVVPAGDSWITVNSEGEVFLWDDNESWRRIFVPRGEAQRPAFLSGHLAGPVYDPVGEQLLTFRAGVPQFAPLAAAGKLLVGKRDDDFRRTEGVSVPDGAADIFLGKDELLVAAPQGIYRLQGDMSAKQPDINLFGLHIPLPQRGGQFNLASPKVNLRQLDQAAIDPISGAIALFDGRRLLLFPRLPDGTYGTPAEHTFTERQRGDLAVADGKVFLIGNKGTIQTYDSKLEPGDVIHTHAKAGALQAIVSPDGRYLAVLFRNRHLWLYDVKAAQPRSWSINGQGDISAVAFTPQSMLVADRLTRVTSYDLDKMTAGRSVQGTMPLVETIYRYVLHPLYTVLPKPGELNQTVSYVLTGDEVPGALGPENRDMPPIQLEVWGPIWSNLAFLIVVLAIGCAYVSRKDF